MKGGKKRGKRKSKRWAFKSKLTYGLVAGVFVISCFLIFFFLIAENQTHVDSTPKAAIVDHLSDSFPNQTFVGTSQSILRNAGFKVYYYSKVAVDQIFLMTLPGL